MNGNDKQLRRQLFQLHRLLKSGMMTTELLADALLNLPDEPKKVFQQCLKQQLRVELNKQYATCQVYLFQYMEIWAAIEKK
ncbi:hypothetical protein [Spirosoma agri]|uniref:Uncharacterized protein n=1 Tax=Spirosoma agri TaxID=1987381 RepID=A0A6M0IHV6_9BACT|nr:hypothetical protein [Spirosoma agri]NEU67467.1 hypothetical protein [Spirosoma agri]